MRLGPVAIISAKRYKELLAAEKDAENLDDIFCFVRDTFGNLDNARRVLSRATVLADSFRSKEAEVDKVRERLQARFCEYTGVLKEHCYCGNHGR